MANPGLPAISRRSAVQTGVMLLGGLALGRSGSERASARDETAYRARIYGNDLYPEARFRVVSDSLDYKPTTPIQEGEAFIVDLYWSEYDTRIVRYENTREEVLFFPPLDADVERETTYRTGRISSTDELVDGIVTIEVGRTSE